VRVLALPSDPLTSYGSSGASLCAAARVLEPQDGLAVDVVRRAPGGTIGRHPTRLWQLFLVVPGSGWASGGDDRRRALVTGAAALWEPGEEHARGTDDGLTAVVVQSRVVPLTEEALWAS
jgi:quercetin dioxygenase-like cupin family protein